MLTDDQKNRLIELGDVARNTDRDPRAARIGRSLCRCATSSSNSFENEGR